MAFTLSSLKNTVANVARNQYFLLKMPSIFDDKEILTAMVRTIELPAMTYGKIELPVRGFQTKHTGSATYNDWSVTFLCDEEHAMRKTFLLWQMLAANPIMLSFSNKVYKKEVSIQQIGKDGNNDAPKAVVIFYGMFPINVGQVSYDQAGGSFCTFDVTFAYDYYLFDHLKNLHNTLAATPTNATVEKLSTGSITTGEQTKDKSANGPGSDFYKDRLKNEPWLANVQPPPPLVRPDGIDDSEWARMKGKEGAKQIGKEVSAKVKWKMENDPEYARQAREESQKFMRDDGAKRDLVNAQDDLAKLKSELAKDKAALRAAKSEKEKSDRAYAVEYTEKRIREEQEKINVAKNTLKS